MKYQPDVELEVEEVELLEVDEEGLTEKELANLLSGGYTKI